MKWDFSRNFLRTESFFGIVAVVIAVSNAPIFQNIGLVPSSIERTLLVCFYISLIFALLALFFGRILFELYCPDVVKKAGTLEQHIGHIPDDTDEDAQIRLQMTAEWRTANQSERGQALTTISLAFFLFLFPLSFCLAALTLIQFGLTTNQGQQERQSNDIRFELVQECVAKPSETPESGCFVCPRTKPPKRCTGVNHKTTAKGIPPPNPESRIRER